MKRLFTPLFLFFHLASFAQVSGRVKNPPDSIVTFVSKVDIANATKDGIYMAGYVVNIDYDKAKNLNGKKVRVTGKVTIEKGLKNLPPNKPPQPPAQGREEDTKHIESPKIEILSN